MELQEMPLASSDQGAISLDSPARAIDQAADETRSGEEDRGRAGILQSDPFGYDVQDAHSGLLQQANLIFSNTEVYVDIINASCEKHFKAEHESFHRENDVLTHIKASTPDLRIISILRKHSLSPLMISRELLIKILGHHSIGPGILDLFPAFSLADELSEKGNSLWSIRSTPQGHTEISYVFRYMETVGHPDGRKSTERQIGVYHRFGGNTGDVMILLHANTDTKAHRRLQEIFSRGQYQQKSATSPFLLHAFILGTYLNGWRPYLQELGSRGIAKENEFLTIGLEHPLLCFKELQRLRDLESKLIISSGILRSTLSAIQDIEACARNLLQASLTQPSTNDKEFMNAFLEPELQSLNVLGVKCRGYVQSVDLIQRRVRVVIGLLSDGINQQSQKTANRIADSSKALTQKSVNDSYIVKVVTVITVVYLPMQGVASFFGMNLTSFSQESNRLGFAGNWWLFLAVAVPLTLVTLGGLSLAWIFETRRKRADESKSTG